MEICVPYRSDRGQRARLWEACQQRWITLFPEVLLVAGDREGEPFNRSAARNAAAAGVGDAWQVMVFADADVMIGDPSQVYAAIAVAADTGHLVFAHTDRFAFGEQTTERILGGADPNRWVDAADEHHTNTFSSVYAVPRMLWARLGGFDERFQGWGFEDLAFMKACATFGGVDRVPGDVYHLWHPRAWQYEEGQPFYGDNTRLWDRYVAAAGNRAEMLKVLTR